MSWFVVTVIGLGNTGAAIVGGLLVGILETMSFYFLGKGWQDALNLAVLILLLVFKPPASSGPRSERVGEVRAMQKTQSLPLGGFRANLAERFEDYRIPVPMLVLVALSAIVPFFVKDEYILRLLTSVLLFGAEAMVFDFTAGYINAVNFGFTAFLGIGAYMAAVLRTAAGHRSLDRDGGRRRGRSRRGFHHRHPHLAPTAASMYR